MSTNDEILNDLLAVIPVCKQRQYGVKDQLADLRLVANCLGMYDAADAIRQLFETDGFGSLRYGCHCDIEDTVDKKPDGCVIDSHNYGDCIYAKPGMRKEQCKYWRIIMDKETRDDVLLSMGLDETWNFCNDRVCLKCSSKNVINRKVESPDGAHEDWQYKCKDCGYEWFVDGIDS